MQSIEDDGDWNEYKIPKGFSWEIFHHGEEHFGMPGMAKWGPQRDNYWHHYYIPIFATI